MAKAAGRGIAAATAANKYLEGRPKFLVLFREPSERTVSLMSKVMGLGEAKGMSARATCTVLDTKDHVHTRVYTRLGIATADLNTDELAELRKNDTVEAIVPNEIRSIPLPPEEEVVPAPQIANERFLAYLQGMRDAVDAMMRQLSPPLEFIPAPPFHPPIFPNVAAAASDDATFSWCLRQIGMSPSYQVATGAGITLAILDTGIDLNHPDFAGRLRDGDTARSFVPHERVQDGNGHGTHCAGVAAGPATSTGGRRYGVAPDATLVVGKVLSDAGSGYDDQILDGIDWAATDMGARIISMSLSSIRSVGQAHSASYERVAERLLASGVCLVAAAGNSSTRPSSKAPVENPAACPSIMAVGAVDRQLRVANFSGAKLDNIGTLDIAGPGVAVYSSWTGGGFRTISGTSMATPHVAGALALWMERNPGTTGQALWNLLISHVRALPDPEIDVGRGLVQVPR